MPLLKGQRNIFFKLILSSIPQLIYNNMVLSSHIQSQFIHHCTNWRIIESPFINSVVATTISRSISTKKYSKICPKDAESQSNHRSLLPRSILLLLGEDVSYKLYWILALQFHQATIAEASESVSNHFLWHFQLIEPYLTISVRNRYVSSISEWSILRISVVNGSIAD